ncbi:MAG TPA: HEAT repeat domain-containing protein [Polyangiaceae bacterium]
MTPLERLVGSLPSAPADFRDYSDMVSQAIFDAAQKDREAFVRVLEEEPTLLESGTVVWALGAVDDERLVPLLCGALKGKEPNVRWSAAHALAKRPSAAPALIDALRDRAPSVRAVVIEALGDLGDARALEPLREALSRPANAKDDHLRKLLEDAIEKLHP